MTVTKQQQLEWLANSFSEWPGLYGQNVRIFAFDGVIEITREEWQQERDKMKKRKEYEELAVMGNQKVAQAVIDAHNALKDLPFASVFMDAWTKVASEFMDSLQNRADIDPIGGMSFSAPIEQIHPVDPEVLERNIKAMTELGATLVTPHKNDNSWHERGELPPVGCECEVKTKTFNGWMKCFVVGKSSRGDTVIECDDCAFIIDSSYEFRPLRTEREMAIDAACVAVGGVGEDGLLIIERLYDAGMLK